MILSLLFSPMFPVQVAKTIRMRPILPEQLNAPNLPTLDPSCQVDGMDLLGLEPLPWLID